MTERILISSGTPWEDSVGYSRVIRVGNLVEVSGTTAVDGSQLIGEGDPYEQARFILVKIGKSLEQAGASLAQVVRTRIYVTDINNWPHIAKAHGEVFGTIKPASSMVEVSRLIDPNMLVEIEATAIV
jgi:enamine deaminase RidA (YjgF/YER057c/UK114 family)